MTDFGLPARKQIQSIPWYAAFLLLVPAVFWLAGYEIGSSSDTAQMLLNALAIAQSSAVAIVASVTLLNVQLVADRYSTEVVQSALQSSPFKLVMSIFIGSIAFDLILLYNIVHHGAGWFTAAVILAAFWAIINAVWLYKFVFDSVGLLTPDSLISAITDYNDISEFAGKANPSDDDSDPSDESQSKSSEEPLYHLYVIISSTIGSIDIHVVQEGLDELYNVLGEVIEELDESDGKRLVSTAFLSYYPQIIDRCLQNGKVRRADDALQDFEELLVSLETDVEGWEGVHFTGIEGLLKIHEEWSDQGFLDTEIILNRLDSCSGSYWTADRLEVILKQVKIEASNRDNPHFFQSLISQTHTASLEHQKMGQEDTKSDVLDLWETNMEDILSSTIRNHQEVDSGLSKQFLQIWPQLYQRNMTRSPSHRDWLVTVIFELAVFHAAHHKGGYETARDAIVNTLRSAQPQYTQERIEALQKLDEKPLRKRREVSIIEVRDDKGNVEKAHHHNDIARNLVSEAIDVYRKQIWDTDKATEYIKSHPDVLDGLSEDVRFMDAPDGQNHSLISNPATSDGRIIRVVVAEEINSDIIDSLDRDGVAKYVCVGPFVTGDFAGPDLDTFERSLPELRPSEQTSIYDYYDWG